MTMDAPTPIVVRPTGSRKVPAAAPMRLNADPTPTPLDRTSVGMTSMGYTRGEVALQGVEERERREARDHHAGRCAAPEADDQERHRHDPVGRDELATAADALDGQHGCDTFRSPDRFGHPNAQLNPSAAEEESACPVRATLPWAACAIT
jgi:hypothetical protein